MTIVGRGRHIMTRRLAEGILALVLAVPIFASTHTASTHSRQAAGTTHAALHLMNDSEFGLFAERLDADVSRWQAQLQRLDLDSLGLDREARREVERSHAVCLQVLGNTREDLEKVSQKQTLKRDLLLLVDLNELTRDLDSLQSDLSNPATVQGNGAGRRSLEYAKQVLHVDATVSARLGEFQNHVLAFAGVIDEALDRAPAASDTPPGQK
jgi:hypothetical protein